ncbi:MAG: hypothetical protein ACO24A_05515, partial [Burkholderiaceae bacterium]
MKTLAFVFPGQGSQAVGMLNGFAGNAAVTRVMQEASQAIGLDLQKMIADGPADVLSLTVNTQPLMLASSVVTVTTAQEPTAAPWRAAPLLQGALFGALFGLIPLWVRQEGAGNCFDFAMVLTAYGLGRAAAEALQARLRLAAAPGYLLLAAGVAGTQVLPGWGAVLLFVPLGLLAASSDQRLILA